MIKTFAAIVSAAMLVLLITASAYQPILVNKIRHDMTYAIGGVCTQHVIHNNDSEFVSETSLQILCGTNTKNCVIELFSSKNCAKSMIAGITLDINKGVKDAVGIADNYSVSINYSNNAVTVAKAIGK